MKEPTYGFIGTGNIGNMLIKQFIDKGIATSKNILSSNSKGQNLRVMAKSDFIYICTRPQDLDDVCNDLRNLQGLEDKVVISTAAGIKSNYYQNMGRKVQLIRAIPSMTNNNGGPLLFNASPQTKPENKHQVYSDLSKFAKVYEVDEGHMDEYTHLASCSPAIIAQFAESYLESIQEDLDNQSFVEVFADSLESTAKALRNGKGKLVDSVCTKEGVTRKGVDYMKENFPIKGLVDTLSKRIKQIGAEYGRQ